MRTIRRIALVLLLVLLPCALAGQQLGLGSYGSFIDPPSGWSLAGQEERKLTFVSGDGGAWLQLKLFPEASSLAGLVEEAQSRLGADGEGTVYGYGTGQAWFGTLSFSADGYEFAGYLFACFGGDMQPTVLLAFSDASTLPQYNDAVLSALDSFSPPPSTNRLPGPVGAFDRVFSSGDLRTLPLGVGNGATAYRIDAGTAETAVYVTEREARLLGQAGNVEAWRRFFRILYRDSLRDLDSLISELHAVFPAHLTGSEARRVAEELLAWLQGFEYRRSGTYSDFLDPVQALVSSAGDCDSLGLLYVLLLHSFDIDAILLVSESYSHALGAVDVPGAGARFSYDGTGYVVAELTDEVDLGLIAADMADPAGWTPVEFPESIRARSRDE